MVDESSDWSTFFYQLKSYFFKALISWKGGPTSKRV